LLPPDFRLFVLVLIQGQRGLSRQGHSLILTPLPKGPHTNVWLRFNEHRSYLI
jgi:hypothetical protein